MKSPLKALFSTPAQSKGQRAEDGAYNYLLGQGLKSVARNYRCKYGEIDLILLDKNVLVFIEVRFRKNTRFGSSAETVTAGKQKKLVLTAQHFILNHKNYQSSPCRFDVVAMSPDTNAGNDKFDIEWIRSAFVLAI